MPRPLAEFEGQVVEPPFTFSGELSPVVLVYRKSRVYTPEYVDRLTQGILRKAPDAKVYVLTDDKTQEFKATKLLSVRPEWTTWWAKLELFRPDLIPGAESICYMDLDSMIVGDITPILKARCLFSGVADFFHPEFMGSDVLVYNPKKTQFLWDRMEQVWPDCVSKAAIWWGDHHLMHDTVLEQGIRWVPIQNKIAGIVSYKKHILRRGWKGDERIVCFHGKPKPSDIPSTDPISQYWR